VFTLLVQIVFIGALYRPIGSFGLCFARYRIRRYKWGDKTRIGWTFTSYRWNWRNEVCIFESSFHFDIYPAPWWNFM